MKFLVSRTSLYLDDDKPCKEAKQEVFQNWDDRGMTEEEYNTKLSHVGGLWRERGIEHKEFINREGKKCIARRWEDRKKWVVEIDTLEGLIKFHDKYGDLVIKSDEVGDPEHPQIMPEIEIYDTYRE